MLTVFLWSHADCNKYTKTKVDDIKSAITYPTWSIDDIVYIAFIRDARVSTSHVADKDIVVKKVRIVDMMMYNSIGGPNYIEGLYISMPIIDFPIKWKYQFIDTSIQNPRYGDRSDFYNEEMFQKTPELAKKALRESLL